MCREERVLPRPSLDIFHHVTQGLDSLRQQRHKTLTGDPSGNNTLSAEVQFVRTFDYASLLLFIWHCHWDFFSPPRISNPKAADSQRLEKNKKNWPWWKFHLRIKLKHQIAVLHQPIHLFTIVKPANVIIMLSSGNILQWYSKTQ